MYLFLLADRVSRGLRELAPDRLARHRAFLETQQTEVGGFRGREGDADLYYTGFAVRAFAVSGGLSDPIRDRVTAYLATIDPLSLNVIDLLSWLYSALVVQRRVVVTFCLRTHRISRLVLLVRSSGKERATADTQRRQKEPSEARISRFLSL